MKRVVKLFSLIFVLTGFIAQDVIAQSDINIFGFYQAYLRKIDGDFKVTGDIPFRHPELGLITLEDQVLDKEENDFTDAQVQQLNLFFQKDISPSFSSFVNLQVVNNFSTKNLWGAFSLEEAWINYQYTDAFNVKAGYLIPKFNYLNEIQNKTPLLPYLIRPLVYEASLTNIVNPTDYLPTKAFIQLSGTIFKDDLAFEYSAFLGPAEDDYISNEIGDGAITPGVDTTNHKTFGGRVGILYSDLRAGASFTFDKDNQLDRVGDDINRTRLGFDFGYSYKSLFVEGEFISVMLDYEKDDIDKSFYYGLLGYNFSDEFYAYGTYSVIKDQQLRHLSDGLESIVVGAGYRPTFGVVVKAEFGNYYLPDNVSFPSLIDPQLPPIDTNIELDFKSFNLAVSVIF